MITSSIKKYKRLILFHANIARYGVELKDYFTVINTEDLSDGIYFVKTNVNNFIAIKKLIILD